MSLDPSAFGPDAHRTMSFLALDPPRHTRMRSLVGKGFTPTKVNAMEERIREITLQHLEPALEAGSFDFIADFAGKVPMDVISELVGRARGRPGRAPPAGRPGAPPRRRRLRRAPGGHGGGPRPSSATTRRWWTSGGRTRRDDLTSALLDAEIDGDKLTDEEIVAFLFLMVVAGNETTTKLLGNAWYWGWRHPDERAKPFADPAVVPAWVEETLRFDTSSQMLLRVTRQPVHLHGTSIAEGSRVLLLVGSANRDERSSPTPTATTSTGTPRHWSASAAAATSAWAPRWPGSRPGSPSTELVGRVATYDVDPDGVERVHSINVRGLAALPTTVTLR